MKIRNSIETLLPTVAYGNVKLVVDLTLDTELEADKEILKSFMSKGADEREAVRNATIEEFCLMKSQVDQLSADSFQLAKK